MATDDKISEEEVIKTLQERLPEDKTAAELRNTLGQLNKEYFAVQRKSKVVGFKKVYAFAAAAAVILFVTIFWPQESYMDEFGKTQMFTVTERGESSDSILQVAAIHFNSNEFEKALPLLDKAVETDSTDQMAQFYRGVARLHTGNIIGSRSDLERIYDGESIFHHEAAFYIALGYVNQKNVKIAADWLQKIPSGTPVSEKAGQLLKKLQ